MLSMIKLTSLIFDIMEVNLIKTEEEYNKAMKRLRVIFQAEKNTPEGDEFEILAMFIEKYEDIHYPMEMIDDPIGMLEFRMEQMGYTQTDLAKVIGLKSRASEILSRKRKLTLEMIRRLNEAWNIPIESLVKAY